MAGVGSPAARRLLVLALSAMVDVLVPEVWPGRPRDFEREQRRGWVRARFFSRVVAVGALYVADASGSLGGPQGETGQGILGIGN